MCKITVFTPTYTGHTLCRVCMRVSKRRHTPILSGSSLMMAARTTQKALLMDGDMMVA